MERQVRSKQRVADHGEVFTPGWMIDAMLDLVKEETERIDSRFLEPACGIRAVGTVSDFQAGTARSCRKSASSSPRPPTGPRKRFRLTG